MSGNETATVEVETFGCRLNAAESDAMLAAAIAAGETDLLIVNSCAVTEDAARRSLRAIRRARRLRPNRRILVTGCASEIEPEPFKALADRVVPNAKKLRIWPGAEDARRLAQTPHTRAFVEVQNGCDHSCTFCVIPRGRGPSRSRPATEVLAAIRSRLDEGRREIVLTGVDLTSWGADLDPPSRLGRLVTDILARNRDLPRLRLSSIDCVEIDPDLIAAIAEQPRLMPHLHLSLQSGCDLILKRMKRRHGRAQAIALCQSLRAARPDLALSADLIVGFPTETEAMFEETCSLVAACGLDSIHVFPFSPRPGTPAARMPQAPAATIRERAARLRALGDAALARRLASHVGSELTVLAERGGLGHAEDFSRVRLPDGCPVSEIVRLLVTESTGRELIGAHRPSRGGAGVRAYAQAQAQ